MFKKIAAFFHSHPGIKTTLVGAAGAALTAAGSGMLGPKGVVIAGAISAVVGLWVKRPTDATPEDKGAAAAQPAPAPPEIITVQRPTDSLRPGSVVMQGNQSYRVTRLLMVNALGAFYEAKAE